MKNIFHSRPSLSSGVIHYAAVLIIIGITVLVCRPLANQKGYYIVSFILLSEVSIMAVFLGIGPVLLASALSSIVWNFFFIPPHFALHIDRTEDKLIFGSFFFIAMVNGVLTNRVRRQEKLALEREERTHLLVESEKLYKTLFTLISHEFRIPIATIMGASETLLISRTSAEDNEELAKEIFKASGRLNHLIENLLNMSRLESGKVFVKLDWCDVNDLINKVTGTLSQQLEHHTVLSTIPPDMPLVRLDFTLMEQVIYNLLLNACQHTPPGTGIGFEAKYLDGDLIFIVSDNGPGFPEDKIPDAFTKFFRVDTSKAGGLGLGLSIVKGLVEAHKGRIELESGKPRGAVFTIVIPTEIPDIKVINLEQ
jgi:two-component system, OmpR family, sensor histidine kinase KdpD